MQERLISHRNVLDNKPIEQVHKLKRLGTQIILITREIWKTKGKYLYVYGMIL